MNYHKLLINFYLHVNMVRLLLADHVKSEKKKINIAAFYNFQFNSMFNSPFSGCPIISKASIALF